MTLSGLLNGIDGVVAAEERMIFMTTNHLEKLDAALTRPGRVDKMSFIGNATESQAKELFLRFYEGKDSLAKEFTNKLKELDLIGVISPAALQGHFVLHKDDAASALEHIESLRS